MEEMNRKVEKVLLKGNVMSLASIDEDGFPRPVPMQKIGSEGANIVWFATGMGSSKVYNYRNDAKAGLSLYLDHNSIVMTGIVDIVTDKAIKAKLWQESFVEYFPKGVDDPDFVLLKFTGKKASVWIDKDFAKLTF
ncbi:MAG: pyridoxamine 5'-phosphate oxidase family protein [Bacteroidetes bacterium]|nr:pyridoxamine 5'-phosphate oxidase family protein [Bacteroidota bacterium]